MTDEDFVSKILQKQENARMDIRSLAEAVSLLCKEIAENTLLLQQVIEFQAAQHEREARQIKISEDIAGTAHSITSLVEAMHAQNQELTGHIRELRLGMSVDASMNKMIAKIEGVGVALDKSS